MDIRPSFSFDVVGILGIIFAIVLLVLDKAGKLKIGLLIGLLCVAGLMTLFLAMGNSLVLDAPAKWRLWRGLLMFCAVAFIYSGLAIWISPSPPEKSKTDMGPEVSITTYLSPDAPYSSGTILGGVVWNPRYVDARLDISSGPVAIEHLDFLVRLDTSIAAMGQISQIPSVIAFPESSPAAWLVGTDTNGEPTSVPITPKAESLLLKTP